MMCKVCNGTGFASAMKKKEKKDNATKKPQMDFYDTCCE